MTTNPGCKKSECPGFKECMAQYASTYPDPETGKIDPRHRRTLAQQIIDGCLIAKPGSCYAENLAPRIGELAAIADTERDLS